MRQSLGRFSGRLVASPAYFVKAGWPVASLDLQSHACLRQRSPSDGKLHVWPLQVGKTGEVIGEDLVPETMCASTTAPLVQLAEGGMGIAFLPPFAVAEQLISGKLISLLSEYVVQTGEIAALWATSRQLSQKIVFLWIFYGPTWKWYGPKVVRREHDFN